MDIAEFDQLASSLAGVRQRCRGGLMQWHHAGRLVARQLDDTRVVVRAIMCFWKRAGNRERVGGLLQQQVAGVERCSAWRFQRVTGSTDDEG